MRRPLRVLGAVVVLATTFAVTTAGAAHAVVRPPTVVDGPGPDIIEVGGVAMADDGTGGVVYTKLSGGVPHVFVSRYRSGGWEPPLRVDGDQPYDAASPRIAAGPRGRLLVVWVTQTATVHGRIQRALLSAAIPPLGERFGPSLAIDGNVGDGSGVAPVLSGAVPAAAFVAYRVVTDDFSFTSGSVAVQLRPGDVMADVRVARLSGDRWSRLGALNRGAIVSMRAPTLANGPRIGTTADGNAVFAWQEPDQTGAARIWMRRIFGTVPGPVLSASPARWNGQPVIADADAFALDVTRLGQAEVVARLAGVTGSPLGGERLVSSGLPIAIDEAAGKTTEPALADGGGGDVGVPSVAAADGGQAGTVRVAYAGAGLPRLRERRDEGLTDLAFAPGVRGAGPVSTSVGRDGGGVTAWPSATSAGVPAVAVRQDFPSGDAQTAVAAPQRGPVAQLALGRSESGDALIGFRQGEAGRFAIVAQAVSAPPGRFSVSAPDGWVRPRAARVSWTAAPSISGRVRYTVAIDGRVVARDRSARGLRLRPRLLGSGVHQVQVLAGDALGQRTLSAETRLRVDGRPPTVRLSRRGHRVAVRVRDLHSGVRLARTICRFGDRGRPVTRRRDCRHRYARRGRYTIVVRTRDRAGNATTRHLTVRIP